MTPSLKASIVLAMVISAYGVPHAIADDAAGTPHAEASPPVSEEEDTDETPESETEGTIDTGGEEEVVVERRWLVTGDLRPILTYDDVRSVDHTSTNVDDLGFRARLGVSRDLSATFRVGARLAGRCTTNACDPEFVMQLDTPGPNGLTGGQFTIDELFLHWSNPGKQRFGVAAGRLQTRFVLRGGVYFKSLDRNDSNNTRVTWTDGLHTIYRAENGWRSDFILQRNTDEGTGSIRRGSLDFDDSRAKNTFFLAFENIRRWGPIVQRSLDVSYLPRSLLKDNDPNGRREDYWGLVGRLALRWPQESEGLRFRGGLEAGYAPATPTKAGSGFSGSGDLDGLAWNVVASAMDIRPGHSLGINYGRTGAGWLLSPQYRENSELFEIRYQWQPERLPLVEARIRWQNDLEKPVGAIQKLSEFDFYLRLTWEFSATIP